MSNQPQASQSIFANWQGTEERPALCDNMHVLDGFNVDFVDGTIRRRRGRKQIATSPTTFRANKYIYFLNATNSGTDYTVGLTDGNTSTAVIVAPFLANLDFLYIGSSSRFVSLKVFLATVATSNGTLTVSFPHGTTWQNVTGLVDGTAVTGNTMKQNGTITWNTADLSSWDPGIPFSTNPFNAGVLGTRIHPDPSLFWVRISVAGGITGAALAELYAGWVGTGSTSLLADSSGLTEFTSRSGNRVIVSVSQTPSRFDDTQQAMAPEVRVVSYDLSRNDSQVVSIDMPGKQSTTLGARCTFVVFNGWLIGTTPSGYLWKWDGSTLTGSSLEALAGNDLLNGVIGAQGYLASTPRGQFLETYHSRLMVAGDPMAPLAFYASLPDNDIINIPEAATVGGPNVWPINNIFGIPGKEGDAITGTAVVNDRYVVLTKNQTWVFDESSLRLANGDIGCIAPGSVQRIDQSVFFLSDQGIVMHDSVNARLISMPIERTLFERVNWKAAPFTAVSAHHRKKAEYWLWLPINGEWQTQIAVVYNYAKNYWRVVGGWYPFDTVSRRGNNFLAISSACQSTSTDGRQALISVDLNGNIFQEDTGYDDNGFIYPAYAVLHRISSYSRFLAMAASDSGENYVSFREWYMNIQMDGSWIGAVALEDGDRFDQELDRQLSSVATKSEFVQKQALIQNSVSANTTQSTYGGSPAWPVTGHFPQAKKLKLSFGRHVTKMHPVIHWTGGQLQSGSFATGAIPTEGAVYDLQISGKPLPTGR